MTGTIAQATNNGIGVAGVARNVKIMPLKVLSGSGSGSVGGIADAIRYAADNGAKVINMSLGGAFPSTVLKKAVEYAHDKGVVVVCAAGNESRGKVGYPAAYPGAIAVAATQYDEATTFYSNCGKEIDIAAPGGNTRVDQNGDGNKPEAASCRTPSRSATRPRTTTSRSWAPRWRRRTSPASPRWSSAGRHRSRRGREDPQGHARASRPTSSTRRDKYGAGIIDAPAAILQGARRRPAAGSSASAC